MVPDIAYTAPQSVTDAVGSLGRTEDVRFSPSNRRLAVASFHRNRIVVLDIDIASSRGATQVALTGGVELSSPTLTARSWRGGGTACTTSAPPLGRSTDHA